MLDLTNCFNKAPEINDVKNHIQSLANNGINYDTLSPDWKIDIVGGKDKVNHIVKSSMYAKMNKSKHSRHRKYIAKIEDLIQNSIYTNNPKSNTKLQKKPRIDTYHYFETTIKIKNQQYKVVLITEQYIGEDTNKPQTVHLYEVIEVK